MNSLITNQLSRLLARVNYNANAVQLISHSPLSSHLIIYLGTAETESIFDAISVDLSKEEATGILLKSGIYADYDWFISTSLFNRLEALAYIKAFLLKSIPVPHLKVA